MEKRLLSEKETAIYLGLSSSYLRRSRSEKNPSAPPYLKIGKTVRYSIKELDEWLASKSINFIDY